VARWVNLNPPRLKENSRSTFGNTESLQIMDLQDCFLPWCDLIEAEINAQLIEPYLQDEAFAEFMMDSLLRADSVARNTVLALKRQWGAISANEWRAKDNENPQPGDQGDKFLVPSNMMDAADIGKAKPAPTYPPGAVPVKPEEPKPEDPKPEEEQDGESEDDKDDESQ
jgi:hypothetical protein